MVPVRWYDTLSFTPTPSSRGGQAGRINLGVVDRRVSPRALRASEALPLGCDNLVVRALELLRQRSGCRWGADVALVKRIPSAAGLGGGSSDAAAALRLGNRGWGLHWTLDRLTALAAELGSDVPFFLAGGAAICRGRGQQVELLPGIRPIDFVIVKPPAELGTRAVYHALDTTAAMQETRIGQPRRSDVNGLVRALRRGARGEFQRWMGNRLQAVAALLSPWIDRVRAACAPLDFLGHQLSGSGTAYFGVCRHARHARRLATILRTRQLGLVYVTRSCP